MREKKKKINNKKAQNKTKNKKEILYKLNLSLKLKNSIEMNIKMH